MPKIQAYYELCKPRVVMLIVFTAMIGMLLAPLPNGQTTLLLQIFILGNLGISMMALSAAAVNQILDRKADASMKRTSKRPLVNGDLTVKEAIVFAALLGFGGFGILYYWLNPLTAWLTLASSIGYAWVYTVWLKHATPQNIVIGGASGAAPPLLGWVAVTGQVSAEPLLLFLIIFIWTPPHFWALAIEKKEEYALVGVPMLPVTHGEAYTRFQVLLYAILLFIITMLPYLIDMVGVVYLISSIILNLIFLSYAWRLYRAPRPGLGMQTFAFSIIYLMLIFAALLIDHWFF